MNLVFGIFFLRAENSHFLGPIEAKIWPKLLAYLFTDWKVCGGCQNVRNKNLNISSFIFFLLEVIYEAKEV